MQAMRGPSKVQFLGNGHEVAQVAELDLLIHTRIISIEINKIFDI